MVLPGTVRRTVTRRGSAGRYGGDARAGRYRERTLRAGLPRVCPRTRMSKWGLGFEPFGPTFPRAVHRHLDVMKDTGFLGLRVTQFPQILSELHTSTAAQMAQEASKRRVARSFTISFSLRRTIRRAAPKCRQRQNGHDFPEGIRRQRRWYFRRTAPTALRPVRSRRCAIASMRSVSAAGEMGFSRRTAQSHGQMVANPEESRPVHWR